MNDNQFFPYVLEFTCNMKAAIVQNTSYAASIWNSE